MERKSIVKKMETQAQIGVCVCVCVCVCFFFHLPDVLRWPESLDSFKFCRHIFRGLLRFVFNSYKCDDISLLKNQFMVIFWRYFL
jgi:hypothetical protein